MSVTNANSPVKPNDVDEPRRPTLPRPVYRPQYFPGWGPKL